MLRTVLLSIVVSSACASSYLRIAGVRDNSQEKLPLCDRQDIEDADACRQLIDCNDKPVEDTSPDFRMIEMLIRNNNDEECDRFLRDMKPEEAGICRQAADQCNRHYSMDESVARRCKQNIDEQLQDNQSRRLVGRLLRELITGLDGKQDNCVETSEVSDNGREQGHRGTHIDRKRRSQDRRGGGQGRDGRGRSGQGRGRRGRGGGQGRGGRGRGQGRGGHGRGGGQGRGGRDGGQGRGGHGRGGGQGRGGRGRGGG